MNTYVTKLGDTWDYIAYKLYGNSKYMKELMNVNTKYLDICVFSSGIKLLVPELDTLQVSEDLPPWRK